MKKLLVVLIVAVFSNSVALAQNNSWFNKLQKIKPLESSEKDVERIFGKPFEEFADVRRYKIEEISLTVTYSEGKCSQNKDSEFDVKKGKVIDIEVFINEKINFKSLNINLAGFKKKHTYDVDGLVRYVNEKKGIDYDVYKGRLSGMSIYPAEKFSSLKCSPENEKSKNEDDEDFSDIPMIDVMSLSLSQNQSLVESVAIGSPSVKNGCLKSSELVNVVIKTTVDSLEEILKKKAPYTRRYSVSAGRIVGEGSEVYWDLLGVKPGTYRITADAALVGGSFNGISLTIEICVVE